MANVRSICFNSLKAYGKEVVRAVNDGRIYSSQPMAEVDQELEKLADTFADTLVNQIVESTESDKEPADAAEYPVDKSVDYSPATSSMSAAENANELSEPAEDQKKKSSSKKQR